jgi:hypothetical protein
VTVSPKSGWCDLTTEGTQVDYLEFKRTLETLGIADRDFIRGPSQQLINADSVSGGGGLEFVASAIHDIKPKDQLEAMLGAQMAVVHMAAMKFIAQLGVAPEMAYDYVERSVTKLMQTFSTQMLTLKRYRIGGEQKVTVQHVSVGDGGRAIVGPVTQMPLNGQPTRRLSPMIEDQQSDWTTMKRRELGAIMRRGIQR